MIRFMPASRTLRTRNASIRGRGLKAQSVKWVALAIVAGLALSLPQAAHAQAKNTPFGTELVGPNYPNTTIQEMLDAISAQAQVGGHGSFVLHWDAEASFVTMEALVPLMHAEGLQSFIQFGATFIGDPAPPASFPIRSFSAPEVRADYLSKVQGLAELRPHYMNLLTEANLFHRFNLDEFNIFVDLYAEAYALIKSISPDTKVGASFHYPLFFGLEQVDLPGILGPHDFIAFTSYPSWLVRDGHFASILDVPEAWYGWARQKFPGVPLIFSEVGWSSEGSGTLADQASFVGELPRLMSLAKPELVTWALLHDVEFFNRDLLNAETQALLTDLGVDIDELFARFNGMGILNGDASVKPAWSEALTADFNYILP